ncbi:hypothetical protein [Streptomyces daliensis]|uniref:SH3 domain-containing protein n=1 Tax=Streptomyces daliensis TaxID=299421 RepID=A0A8T4J4V0_9ACTN|nr:hypothetical protein [Streptomyces daliensis]
MKRKLLGPALGTAALIGTALTGGVATAATPGAAAPTAAVTKAAAHSCSKAIVNVPSKESVKIRKTMKVSGTALALWPKGKKGTVCDDGKASKGGSYKLCGKSSNKWYYVAYGNTKGFVPSACIKW